MENDEFEDPENYGKFFIMSKEVEESLKDASEAQINFMAATIASNIRKSTMKLEDKMKNNQM
jgi:hypothetical protein